MLPKELEDIFEDYDKDDFNLYVTKVDYSGNHFIIDIALDVQNINDKGSITQRWTIQASGHRKNHISFDFAPKIEIRDEHPLLWEFTDTQCELYFAGQPKDTAKLFFDLFLIHKKMFGRHQCFNISFGEDTSYSKPFQFSNGLLTEGSKRLMEEYAECLKNNGLDFTIIGERPAKYWDGEQFILEDTDLKILFIGDTYVIAKGFDFVRQD